MRVKITKMVNYAASMLLDDDDHGRLGRWVQQEGKESLRLSMGQWDIMNLNLMSKLSRPKRGGGSV